MVMDMLKKMLITQNTRISVQKHFVSDPQTAADAIIRQFLGLLLNNG